MRRLALGLAAIWLLVAFGLRLHDMRRPQVYVSALTGGQHHHRATLAWVEGTTPGAGQSRGRLVVVDLRIDGKLERYASARLPHDWPECRLWLEEAPDTVQAVVRCPGHMTLKLTAAGTSLPGLGPDNKPGTLYDLYPVTSVEPEKIVNKIHRLDLAPAHPLLLLLGLAAMVPLGIAALRSLRQARRLKDKPTLEGVMEHAGQGTLTIRAGDRRVTVFVEQGEVISVGLGAGVAAEDAMVVDGLRASVQGEVLVSGEGAFRGQETVRLGRGAVLVVGDAVQEARRRILLAAGQDVVMALVGVTLASIVAAGLAW